VRTWGDGELVEVQASDLTQEESAQLGAIAGALVGAGRGGRHGGGGRGRGFGRPGEGFPGRATRRPSAETAVKKRRGQRPM
jgi:hypothetical protein